MLLTTISGHGTIKTRNMTNDSCRKWGDFKMVLEMGMRIKLKRIEKKLKQYEVAELVGISREYLRLIENDSAKNPSIAVIKKIAEVLETPIHELFF